MNATPQTTPRAEGESRVGFIDTHTHIYSAEFDADRDAVVSRARAAGAEALLLPCEDAASIPRMLRLCADYPGFCFPMMGLQPEELPADPWPLVEEMGRLLHEAGAPYIAVGEVGLDYYWDDTRKAEQIAVLREEVGWACELGLPLSIHCRSAQADLLQVLRPRAAELHGGVFHCFSGTADEARELLELPGFYLGIGGIVTFRRSTLPETLAAAVPLSRLVVETDAPYLTPTPLRGKRNEPAYIPHIIDKLAEIYATTPADVAHATTKAARRLFRL